ncbi:DMT family transporter [Botrimarina hoheduenensis]|uniref:DMT family transporter n=1 Tax=Botrimarina hoheduenensis TaxID=2528000 RepID=UPI0018D34DB1|nr:DMT family transporter [Botrimarina hoheduenensis]
MIAYFQFALICLFFGSNFILMSRASRWFGPVEIGLGRVFGAAILLAIVWIVAERSRRLRPRDLRNIALVAVIANAYPYAAQPTLIASFGAHSFFGMTVAFTPLLTILVSIPVLGIHPTWRQIIGVIGGLGFIGMLLNAGALQGITVGMLAMAVTVPLSYALGNTWLRRTLRDADPTPMSVAMLMISSLTLAPLALAPGLSTTLGIGPPTPRTDFAIAAAALGALGALGTGACVWMFVRLVQSHGPLFAGMVTYVVPVMAILWGLADGETITSQQLIAVSGILSMVALVQAPTQKHTAEESGEWSPDPLTADA